MEVEFDLVKITNQNIVINNLQVNEKWKRILTNAY